MGTAVLGIFYQEDFPSRSQAGLRTRKIGGSPNVSPLGETY